MEHFFKEKVHIWRDSTTGIATQAKEKRNTAIEKYFQQLQYCFSLICQNFVTGLGYDGNQAIGAPAFLSTIIDKHYHV